MEIKTFEIRDNGTFIPVMVIHGVVADIEEPDYFLIRNAGWAEYQEFFYLMNLHDCRAQFDPYKWGGCRTMLNAHKYIREH
jgi:hypothetical protein